MSRPGPRGKRERPRDDRSPGTDAATIACAEIFSAGIPAPLNLPSRTCAVLALARTEALEKMLFSTAFLGAGVGSDAAVDGELLIVSLDSLKRSDASSLKS